MRKLSEKEVESVNGGWVPVAMAAARMGYAVYRSAQARSLAQYAATRAGIIKGTYAAAEQLDKRYNSNR